MELSRQPTKVPAFKLRPPGSGYRVHSVFVRQPLVLNGFKVSFTLPKKYDNSLICSEFG
jgi:hypothetical protein